MSVITLKIVVPNLSEALEHFDKIKVYRSINGISGTYAEITDPTTRLSLEPGKTIYEYTDEQGDAAYYYKSSYYQTVSGLESSLSDAQQGQGDGALDIISVSELKDLYLFGLDLTNDEGVAYPTTLYEHFIRSAVSWLEHRLDIPIQPVSVTDEAHDFFREDYGKYIWMRLKRYPVIDVEAVKMVLPGEVVAREFEREWFHLQKESGQLQLVPGSASAQSILLGAAGAWLPYIYGINRFIPDVFRVTYTAGFESGKVPDNIKDIIAKKASFGPLNIAGDLLGGAGIASQSISIDGLSQSFNTTSSATNAGYGARLLQYGREIKEVLPMLERYYKGFRLTVV